MRLLILLAFVTLPMVTAAAPPAASRKGTLPGKAAAKSKGEKVSYVGTGEDGGDYFLVNDTLRNYGENGRYVIALINYKAPPKSLFSSDKPYLSKVLELYVKCDSHRGAFGNFKAFSGAMGNGEVVDESTEFSVPKDDELDDVKAGTVTESLFEAACKVTPR